MKKNFYLLATLLVGSLTFFSACSDDDDDNGGGGSEETVKTATVDATDYAKWVYFKLEDKSSVAHAVEPIAGTYSGDLVLSVMGQEQGTVEDIKLEVTRVSADSVSMVLKDFAFGSYGTIGDITSGATITVETLGWELVGGEVSTALPNMNVKASSKGLIAGKDLSLTITMNLGSMPMPLTATYTATIEEAGGVDESSFDWDIALHAYDVKTNGGSAIATTEKELSKVTSIPASGYIADIETDSLMVDRTGMMASKIGYACDHLNEVLGEGVVVHLDNMPPTYTMSELVYIIKLKSGEYAKIKFTDYANDENVKGHITFDYVYPFK